MKRQLLTSVFVLLLGSLLITSGCSSIGNALPPDSFSSAGQSEISESEMPPESSRGSSAESSVQESIQLSSDESMTVSGSGSGNKPSPESSKVSGEESTQSSQAQENEAETSGEISSSQPENTDTDQQEPQSQTPAEIPESYENVEPESSLEPEGSGAPEINEPSVVGTQESTQPPVVSQTDNKKSSPSGKSESSVVSSEGNQIVVHPIRNVLDTTKLKGLKLGAVGDSVVRGHQETGFAELLANDYKMELDNYSSNGATIARDIPYRGDPSKLRKCIPDKAQKLSNDCDLIVTDGGYNDFVNSVPLGEMTRKGEDPDPNTFYGGLERLCMILKSKNPKYGSLFVITHRVMHNDNNLGLSFSDYRLAILRVCGKYDIKVLDLYAGAPTKMYWDDNKNEGIYTQLGQGNIHPTERGYREYYLPNIAERFCYMVQ